MQFERLQVEDKGRKGFWNDVACSRSDRSAAVCQAEEEEEEEDILASLDNVNRFRVIK